MVSKVPFYDSLGYMFNTTPYLAGNGNGTGVWMPLNVRLNGGFLTKGGQTCKPAKFGRFRTVQEVLVSIVRVE